MNGQKIIDGLKEALTISRIESIILDMASDQFGTDPDLLDDLTGFAHDVLDELIARGLIKYRVSDRSGEADETRSGSASGEGAGPKDNAHE